MLARGQTPSCLEPLRLVLTASPGSSCDFPGSYGVSLLPTVSSVDLLCWTSGIVHAPASTIVWPHSVRGTFFVSSDGSSAHQELGLTTSLPLSSVCSIAGLGSDLASASSSGCW